MSDEIHVAVARNGKRYRLLSDCYFPDEFLCVPAGFVTDFASVPKILWWCFPPTGFYAKAALLHDWCYFHGPILGLTRWEADAIFRRQMKRDGVGWRTRWTMWLAVRLFGARFWEAL